MPRLDYLSDEQNDEWVKKYSDDVLGFEFWVGDEYEYWKIKCCVKMAGV